jgi:hypothetical protein
LEDAIKIEPPMTDLMSEDSDYQDVDNGGAMLVEDLEEEMEQENISPPVLHCQVRSLIPIEDPAPLAPVVEVVDFDTKGEDDAWYIPPVYCCRVYPLDKFSATHIDPLSNYVEDVREDPVAGPHQDDLPYDESEDEMWANLGVNLRSTK